MIIEECIVPEEMKAPWERAAGGKYPGGVLEKTGGSACSLLQINQARDRSLSYKLSFII